MSNQALYLDQALTDVSNAWFNDDADFIADKIFPEVLVKKPTFKVGKYGKDGLRLPTNSLRTGESKAQRINLTRGYDDIGPLQEHALSDVVTADDYNLTDDPFSPEADTVENINEVMRLIDEKDLAKNLSDVNIVTQNDTLSGTDQWSDYENSDPLADIVAGVKTGKFVKYNTIFMGAEVWLTLTQHPKLLARVTPSQLGVLTQEIFLKLLEPYGIKNMHIGQARENTGKEGLADNIESVWGRNFWLGYVTDRPGRKRVNGGYKFRLENARRVTKEQKNNPPVTEIVNTDFYGHFLLSTECFYLIKNAVAPAA